MLETKPRYDFRDVLSAPARALSAKQILVMTLSLLLALTLYDMLYYLAVAIDAQNLSATFNVYGFFPFTMPRFEALVARAVFYSGVAAAVLAVMLGFFAVAAINIESIRGNRFFSSVGSLKFAASRFWQLFLSELSIAAFVGFIIFLFALLGLVSRIPIAGEWLFVILFALPNFIIALLSVFIISVFTLTILLLPAVAAAEREGESFGVIVETFSTIIRQPLRWAGYTAYSLVAAKLAGFVYAYFAYRAVEFMVFSASIGGGRRIADLVNSGLAHLPVRSEFAQEMFNVFPGVSFGVEIQPMLRSSSDSPVSYAMAVMLFLCFLSILGYMGAVLASAQARGYVAIRQIKDGYSIADESPMFFTDEHVNPKIAEEA